jgi:hypothetical protein
VARSRNSSGCRTLTGSFVRRDADIAANICARIAPRGNAGLSTKPGAILPYELLRVATAASGWPVWAYLR